LKHTNYPSRWWLSYSGHHCRIIHMCFPYLSRSCRLHTSYEWLEPYGKLRVKQQNLVFVSCLDVNDIP
jgi:hypothetical protein